MKTLAQIITEKKFTNPQQVKGFLAGKKIKILSNNGGASYQVGTECTTCGITSVSFSSRTIANLTKDNGQRGNNIYWEDVGVGYELSVEGIKAQLEDVAARQKELASEKKMLNSKLNFLKDTEVKAFTDNEYKAYMTLKTFNDPDMTDIEKAQAIAKLIEA